MRIINQPLQLRVATIIICFFLLPSPAQADGGEEYYKELRKLKSFNSETLARIKSETTDAEQIKKVNSLSSSNALRNAQIAKKKKITPPADSKDGTVKPSSTTSRKETPIKTAPKKSEPASAPIKVNNDGPDELSFPGTND